MPTKRQRDPTRKKKQVQFSEVSWETVRDDVGAICPYGYLGADGVGRRDTWELWIAEDL